MEGSANDFLIEHMHGGSSGIVDTQGMATSLLVFGCLLVFVDLSRCLRMEMLDIPAAANQGESIELSCIYDLENDRLYSIKWYKNDVEFYRYVPNDWPPGQFLPLPGVRVDLSKSGKRSVYLRSVDLNSTGTYRCEVSAEAPSFQSVEAERELNVMVLPTEGPRITGGQPKYNVGDTVAINCTSAKSKPAATLRWFINDQPIGPEYDTEHSTTLHEDGLETSSLSLKFVARDKHFVDHTMRLRCTASISRMYTMSNEELFMGGRQQSSTLQIHENESREKPIKGSSNPKRKGQKQSMYYSYNTFILPTEGPRITGGQPKYNVGDTVAINCTSAKSKPAATLRWFINDQPIGPEYDTEHSTTLHEDGLETSSLSLKFVARDKHFVDHTMRLRCTASISRMYTMSNEELFMGGRQQSSTLQIHENESREKPIKGSSNPKRKGQKQRVDVEKKHHALVEYSETIPEARFNVTSGPNEDPITETEQFSDNNSVNEGEDTTQKSSIVYFTMQSASFGRALYPYHCVTSFIVMVTLLRIT
ncbi:uncharacterized protein LOC129234603 [Uloborus diversus]|uniref:uncharacterized protein LOC129234603 n=1 Tax=Uloborus diversus TaxID=327109 RepID=UPI002409EF83|nr:uncharacterized protein LOC129234603 [Uloborus diversus]